MSVDLRSLMKNMRATLGEVSLSSFSHAALRTPKPGTSNEAKKYRDQLAEAAFKSRYSLSCP